MTTGMLHDQNLEKQIEKQMGCMAGFLQLFDRHQIITGKRLYTTKRLSHYPGSDSASQSERSIDSPAYSSELRSPMKEQSKQIYSRSSPQHTPEMLSPAPEVPAKAPLHLPVLEFKEGLRSSWKFKEAPRLSLDSRATVDGKGSLYPKEIRFPRSKDVEEEENEKQKRSPSVIAKLMGLEALPESGREPIQKVELRRSASESRVSRDLRFMDGNNFQQKQQQVFVSNTRDNVAGELQRLKSNVRKPEPQRGFNGNMCVSSSSWKSQHQQQQQQQHYHQQQQQQQQRKSYFDAQDIFPEPKQTDSLYGEIEKRLKLRGIDEPTKDLETLKQILEALQLKGLLHSNRAAAEQARNLNQRNIIFDRRFSSNESPIVLMKPVRSMVSVNHIARTRPDSPPNLRSKPEQFVRGNRDRAETGRNQPNQRVGVGVGGGRVYQSEKSQRRRPNDPVQHRKISPAQSPKTATKITTNKSPRNRRSTAEISPRICVEDETSTISESSRSSSSPFDTDRSKMEEYKEGRSLLARCDKLLHSIAEMTAASSTTSELQQPSPVSVLDYKDESSPSPVMKHVRSIDFKDGTEELEEDTWSPVISPVRLKFNDQSDDCDYQYVSEILRASNSLSDDTDVFLLLEKHGYKSNSSEVSRLHRRLVFDIIMEILNKKTQLPPWKAFSGANSVTVNPSLEQIWSEFQRIRERDPTEDLFEVIFGVLRKDMAGDAMNGWGVCQVETSEAVLDIERLIFKDLVGETIRNLAAFSARNRGFVSRRRLIFE